MAVAPWSVEEWKAFAHLVPPPPPGHGTCKQTLLSSASCLIKDNVTDAAIVITVADDDTSSSQKVRLVLAVYSVHLPSELSQSHRLPYTQQPEPSLNVDCVFLAASAKGWLTAGTTSVSLAPREHVTSAANVKTAPFGPGSSPTLTLASPSQGPAAVLGAWTGGYCENSHSHNTQTAPALCAQEVEPTPGVLQYVLASSLSRFADAVRAGDRASVCSERLFSGVFGHGVGPSAALACPQQGDEQGFADGCVPVVVHEGWDGSDSGSCGAADAKKGAVVADSWPAPYADIPVPAERV